MSTTPADHLAHLCDVFGERWRIVISDPGRDMTRLYIWGYSACPGGSRAAMRACPTKRPYCSAGQPRWRTSRS
jgi:hypothetical protein